jgi:flagellar protein FliL
MSDAKDKTEKADAPAAPKKKSKLVWILLIAAIVVLAGSGGAGAYWYFSQRSAESAEGQEAKTPEPEAPPEPGLVEMDPFVVNLADPGGQRYVRVSMRLLTYDEAQALEMKENAVAKAKLRAAILELLSMQTADGLVTPEGKNALKKAIAERAAHTVHELKVTDVLFAEFIVQ